MRANHSNRGRSPLLHSHPSLVIDIRIQTLKLSISPNHSFHWERRVGGVEESCVPDRWLPLGNVDLRLKTKSVDPIKRVFLSVFVGKAIGGGHF